MTEDVSVYLQFLLSVVKRQSVADAFALAAVRHREIERDFNRRILASCPAPAALSFPHVELPAPQYWQRNFFSILFLSIFDAVGISSQRQRLYGLLLHAVRGIVTATDNILDDEAKGSVRLSLQGGKVLPNVLTLLLESGVLNTVLRELCADESSEARTWRGLMQALFALGSEESAEESAVERVLSPKELLAQVHSQRGGGLLLLAFVSPALNEPQLTAAIERAKSGVNLIGLALQILDDLTDFEEDLRRRNHNMLRSWIIWNQPDGPCSDAELAQLSAAVLDAPERHFKLATAQVMRVAIELALAGFQRLHEIGHPTDRGAALELISAMFQLRGLARLWALFNDDAAVSSVDVTPYFPA
jgi:hypothetical protein